MKLKNVYWSIQKYLEILCSSLQVTKLDVSFISKSKDNVPTFGSLGILKYVLF